MCKFFICIYIVFCISANTVNATDSVIEAQMQALDLSSFIKEGQIYTNKIFPDINVENLLTSALSRKC